MHSTSFLSKPEVEVLSEVLFQIYNLIINPLSGEWISNADIIFIDSVTSYFSNS